MQKRVLAVLFCFLAAQGCSEVSTSVSGPVDGATATNNSAGIEATDNENDDSPNSSSSSSDNVSLTIGGAGKKIQSLKVSSETDEDRTVSSKALIEEANEYGEFGTLTTTLKDMTETIPQGQTDPQHLKVFEP